MLLALTRLLRIGASVSLLLHCGRTNFETNTDSLTALDAAIIDGPKAGPDAGSSSTSNLVFATSKKFRGNLGGVTGADQECQSAAIRAGIGTGREFIALIAAAPYRAFDRMQASRGWQRPDGVLVADRPADFITGQINTITVDESGVGLPDVLTAWTGMLPDGSSNVDTPSCSQFTASATTNSGNQGPLTDQNALFQFSDELSCDSLRRLVCVSIGFNNPPIIKSPAGKRLFTTSNTFYPQAGGVLVADQICRDEASDAGLGTNFVALLPRAGASAISRLTDASADYYRVDGTFIGKLSNPRPTTFLGMTASAAFVVARPVWTGGAPQGSSTSSCSDWVSTNPIEEGMTGYGNGSLASAFLDHPKSCGDAYSVYCVEQ